MAFQTRDEAQDKVSRKLDRVLNKKKKIVPLSQESWSDLNQRGATLAEQYEWIRLDNKKKEQEANNLKAHLASLLNVSVDQISIQE